MNRRKFLKTISKFLAGAGVLYIGKLTGVFQSRSRKSNTPKEKEAKFYRQADDLAG